MGTREKPDQFLKSFAPIPRNPDIGSVKNLDFLHGYKTGEILFPVISPPAVKSHQLIENRRCWCKGSMKRNYPDRVARCALEAINEAYCGNLGGRNSAISRLFNEVQKDGWKDVPVWNDRVGHSAVHAKMKELDI